ncbi:MULTISPECIES: porin [Rhodopseudomonas]|nr:MULTISPECIES: porin [Rhodopseudomonas]WOK19225.1 porin [Rhodopseudomonas sp. BAL398]
MADDKRATKPPPRQVKSNPCAAFGPGFVMAEGTSTCVKLGGSISVGVGSRTR